MLETNKIRQRRYFNSIKVRLEQHRSNAEERLPKFQFHKGTIRTKKTGEIIKTTQFQFHKGTIRTIYVTDEGIVYIEFQFHKGTIRTTLDAVKCIRTAKFQFHKGTIRTPIMPCWSGT